MTPEQLLAAQPGWRLAVLGPDEDLEACPIVAWVVADAEKLILEPIARVHGQDGYVHAELNAGRPDHVVGILAPGEEVDVGWVDAGGQLAEAIRDRET